MNGALHDKVIVNTRTAHQAAALDMLLRARGAIPLHYPCIAIIPPVDKTALDKSLVALAAGQFDWLVLTSANTVIVLAERVHALNLNLSRAAFRVAAVGEATAEAAQELLRFKRLDLPSISVAESLAEDLPIESGDHILLPQAAIARPTLTDRLTARGAVVHVINAYHTVCAQDNRTIAGQLTQHQINALTFTSSSTVSCLLERVEREGMARDIVLNLCAACIGSATASTARAYGFKVVTVAAEPSLIGLVESLETHFARQVETGEDS